MPDVIKYDRNAFIGNFRKDYPEHSELNDSLAFEQALIVYPGINDALKAKEIEFTFPEFKRQRIDVSNVDPEIGAGLSFLTPKDRDTQEHFTTGKPSFLGMVKNSAKQMAYNFPETVASYVALATSTMPIDYGMDAVRAELTEWRQAKVAELSENPEVQAIIKWNENEPVRFSGEDRNWYHPDIVVRSIAEGIPSLALMAVTGLAAGGLKLGAKGMFIMVASATGALEATANNAETYDDAIRGGLSPEDANEAAVLSSSIYGPLAGIIEAASFSYFLKWTGLSGVASRSFRKQITKAVLAETVKAGGWKTFAKVASAKTARALSQTIVEGAEEWSQFMTDEIVKFAVLNRYGVTTDAAITNLSQLVEARFWDEQAQRSLHAGLSIGFGIGFPGATISTPRAFAEARAKENFIREINEAIKDANLPTANKRVIAEKVADVLTPVGTFTDITKEQREDALRSIYSLYTRNIAKTKGKPIVGKPKKGRLSKGFQFIELARKDMVAFRDAWDKVESKDATLNLMKEELRSRGITLKIENVSDVLRAIDIMDRVEILADVEGVGEFIPEVQEPDIREVPLEAYGEPTVDDRILSINEEPTFAEPQVTPTPLEEPIAPEPDAEATYLESLETEAAVGIAKDFGKILKIPKLIQEGKVSEGSKIPKNIDDVKRVVANIKNENNPDVLNEAIKILSETKNVGRDYWFETIDKKISELAGIKHENIYEKDELLDDAIKSYELSKEYGVYDQIKEDNLKKLLVSKDTDNKFIFQKIISDKSFRANIAKSYSDVGMTSDKLLNIAKDIKNKLKSVITKPIPKIADKIERATKAVGKITGRKDSFQIAGVSEQPLISEVPIIAKEIEERLAKHYPFIESVKVAGIIERNGIKAVGMAIGNVAKWSTTRGTIDTAPHEYAHIYIDMLDESDVVKRGIVDFGGKEQLVEHIGNYYADAIQDKTVLDRIRRWLKRFWARVRYMLGTKKAVGDIIADKFFMGETFEVGRPKVRVSESNVWYQRDNQSDTEVQTEIELSDSRGSTQALENYYSNIFGNHVSSEQYLQMAEMTRTYETFGEFKINFVKWINDNFSDANYTENGVEFNNRAKQFFVKTRSKINIAKSEGEDGRIYLSLVFEEVGDGKITNPSFEFRGEKELVSNRRIPDRIMSNFVEDDGRTKVYRMRAKDIVKHRRGSDFYRSANLEFTADYVYMLDRMFLQNYDGSGGLLFFLGALGDTASQLLFSGVPSDIIGLSKDEIIARFKDEVGTTISKRNYLDFLKDGKEFEKNGTKVWNQIYGKHEVTKKIKGNDYLLREKNVYDTFNRFKMDFSEGYVPIGVGPEQLMIVNNKKVEVRVRVGNLLETSIPYIDYDGWKIVGSRRMRDIQDIVGRDIETTDGTNLSMIKTSQRFLSEDGNNYIGEKMMDFTPFRGMEFYKIGENKPFARIIEDGDGETMFEQLNKYGRRIKLFDSMVSTNEAKQLSGKFTEEKGGFYVVHELPESSTKVIILPSEKAKSNPAHPIGWYDQLWSPEQRQDLYDDVIGSIKRHINKVTKIEMDKQFRAELQPHELRSLAYQPLKHGQAPTELQKIMELLPNGVGLEHPTYLSQILPMLKNRIMVDQIFKARQKGLGTKLYLKPRVHLDIGESEFAVSIDNATVVNIILTKMGMTRDDNFDLSVLNNWLSNNNLEFLLSKPPIEKVGAVDVYKLRLLTEAGHGDALFLHENTVKGKLQSDHDADSALIELFENKTLINSIKNLTSSTEYMNRDKKVFSNLDYYEDVISNTSSARREDVATVMAAFAQNDGALASIVIAKSVSNKMAMKELSFVIDGKTYTIKSPNEMVNFSITIDKNKVSADLFAEIYNEGDYFIHSEGQKIKTYEEYLDTKDIISVTSYEHSLTILMQMAADPKFGLLKAVGFNKFYLASRMFKTDGKSIEKLNKKTATVLNNIIRYFSDSSFKNGRNTYGQDLTFQELYMKSYDLNNVLSLKSNEQGKAILSQLIDLDASNDIITDLKVNGKIGITEHLLIQPTLQMQRERKRLDAKYQKHFPIRKDEAGNIIESPEQMEIIARDSQRIIMSSEYMPIVNSSKSIDENAHRMVMYEIISNMNDNGLTVGKKLIKISKTDVESAEAFIQETGNEFYELLAKNEDVVYDRNKDFVAFTSKQAIKFEALNAESKALSTLFFLVGIKKSGKHFRIKNVGKLLPFDLMESSVLKNYLNLRYDALLSNQKVIDNRTYETQVNELFIKLDRLCP